MSVPLRILILEDRLSDAELMLHELRHAGFVPEWRQVETEADYLAFLDSSLDIILADYTLPQFDAVRALELLRERNLDVPFIIVSGTIGEECAIAAIHQGATDYLLKDRLGRLGAAVQRAIGQRRLIIERKRLEAQLLQAQKIESVGRLAGGVAHDINNVLTAIIGYAELAIEASDPETPIYNDLEEILKVSRSATSIIRQLLAFSRQQMIEPRIFDLNGLIRDLGKLLMRLIGEDIELTLQLAPTLGLIKADPGQMEQVLVNLVVNARDAMPDGGKLMIETSDIALDQDYARQHIGVNVGCYVLLSVSDTGVGMSEAVMSHMFEPFFTTKGPGKGTGLGLATCYGIVKQSGGHIWVYSEPGHGTTIKIYLPHADAPAEAPHQHDAAPDTLQYGAETILLVEDEQAIRDLVARVLRRQGYTVLEATNGAEALLVAAAYEDKPIDLLLTDVVMPQLGGQTLAAQLQGQYPGLKALFMSGYTGGAMINHSRFDPGIAFLQKPFSPTALAHKVRSVLDGPG